MSPAARTQVTLNRPAFQQHFETFWGSHEWPEDAVLVLSYYRRKGVSAPSSVHVPVELEAVWEKMVEIGSDRKMWIGIAPRSMEGLKARIIENKAWNAAYGDEVRAFNEEHAEAILAGEKSRKKLKATELEWVRGGKEECYPMPGFFLDADVSMESAEHNEHKMDKTADGKEGRAFPNREQFDLWLEAFPMKPTFKIWTGAGYHLWWSFLVLLSAQDQAKFLARFKAYWVNVSKTSGLHIDVGVIESSRVGRPAGSLKGKGEDDVFFTPIETVEFNPSARFTTADMEFLPEYFDPKREKRVRNDDGTTSVRPVSTRSQAELDALPGTKLSHNLPVSELLEQVLEFHRDGDKFTAPWDGDYEYGKVHAALYTAHDGAELVKVFGERTSADLGLDGDASTSSFGLLINHWCKKDADLAFRIAAHYEHSVEDLIELLQAEPTVEELLEQFPERVRDSQPSREELDRLMSEYVEQHEETTPGTISVDEELEQAVNSIPMEMGSPITIQEHMDAGVPYQWTIEGAPTFFVQIAPGVTGLYERITTKTADGKSKEFLERHTHWVAWRSEATSELVLTPEGKPVEAVENTYTVQLIHSSGRIHEARGLSGKDSSDAKIVLQKMNAGVTLPVGVIPRRHMDNVLTAMGRYDGQEDKAQFTSTGILKQDGKYHYLQPAGSINADGITHDFTVSAPAGSDKDGLRPAMTATGFDRIAEGAELAEAAKSVTAYFAISPERADYSIATLGALPAAVLPQSRRSSVVALAKPGIGKSIVLSALQAFVSKVGVDGKSFSMTFSNGTTGFGASLIAAWHNASCGFYDDFRLDEDIYENKKRTSAMNNVIQGSYGADGRAAGNGVGLRGSSTTNTMSVITGEGAPPSGTAIHSRYIRLSMEKGDFAITPRGASPLDTFVDEYARTGLARAFFASFVQWVMAKIDASGSIMAFQDEVDRRKMKWESDVDGRSAETASTVVVGWMYLIDWATERGIDHLLPTIEVVSKTMLAVASDNAVSVAQLSPGRMIVEKIAEMIGGGAAYVQSHTMDFPKDNERLLGWEQSPFDGSWTHGNKTPMGFLSEDRKWIHVPAQALNVAVKLTGTPGKSAQIESYLSDFVRPGTKANSRANADLRLSTRVRGYTFSIEALELDLAPVPVMPAVPGASPTRVAPVRAVPVKAAVPAAADGYDDF